MIYRLQPYKVLLSHQRPLPQDPLLFDPLINDPFHPIAPNSLAAASAAHAATHGLPVGPSIHAVISHGSCR